MPCVVLTPGATLRRREFITLLGGAAAAWPLTVRAQEGERVRRIGVLSVATEDDRSIQAPLATLRASLAQLGWVEGRNLQIDLRFGSEDPGRFRTYYLCSGAGEPRA